MLRHIVLAGLLGAGASLAEAAFTYSYVEGGVGEVDEGDALFIGASKSINRNLFVLGSLYYVDPDIDIPGYDSTGYYLEGGLGYAMPLTAQADFFANAQVLYANFDIPGDDDDLGAIARAGLRFVPADRVELEGSVAVSSNDLLVDDGVGASASARFYFAPRVSAAIGYSTDTELDGVFLNLRYALP